MDTSATPPTDGSPSDRTPGAAAPPSTGSAPAPAPPADGPLSEADALRQLAGTVEPDPDREESAQAAAIAGLIAERLQGSASGLTIGTLAMFQDTVSFGGSFNAAGRSAAADHGRSALVRIEADEQTGFVTHFLQPPGYATAAKVLSERHLLVLAAPPGTGREAAAVNLVAEALALHGASDGGTSYWVTEPEAIAGTDWHPPHQEAGYLLVVDDTEAGRDFTARTVDTHWLVALGARLKAARSFLVLVTGPARGALARTADRSDQVRTDLGMVDPAGVLRHRVLGHQATDAEHAQLERLLADSGAARALREQPTPAVAVRLAGVLRAGGDLAREVALVRDPSEQVHRWFVHHDDPATVCFALAAAVLEDCGYLTVADAALRLYASVAPPEASPYGIRFLDRLAQEQPWISINPSDSASGPPRVAFRSELIGQSLLSHAWTYQDGQRDALVGWLRSLLVHPDVTVRAKAAVAAGILAWSDHEHAVHRFLRSWAGSEAGPVRQAAASALTVVASRAELTEWVWDLLDGWVDGGRSTVDRRLAKTAATAVGGVLGKHQPHRALRLLRTALDWQGDWGNLTTVAWSCLALIEQDRERDVLTALLSWSAAQDRSPMVAKSLSVFLFTAGRTDSGDGVPTLLLRARELRPELTELWARALGRRPIQDQALPILREWVDCYRKDDRTAAELRALIGRVAALPGKHRERLTYYLDRWSRDRDQPSPGAAALLDVVERLP
ncbi:hypothetical protein C7C46_16325 [Streptomyces tateyamensis]|uniref:Uncharacterized protein n=1 Tax=Streptomyces tateyamensis TaxID=565073 RepID=A0A2V4N3F6_9ACTN|nr:hypothetical protein [Streptomyces tateyamensis]PYC78401.1 hypothetical protein C7C46_16325 [Streptomyces tateyamensis]